MAIIFLIIIVVITVYFTRIPEPYFGKFIGTVKTEWLEPDRKMKLLDDFAFIDPNNVTWRAPAGSVVDGASIPPIAWSLIGGPFSGKYREASVIHDVACKEKNQSWESVHEAFWYAMRASGVNELKAKIMYAAVYHGGPTWEHSVSTIVPRTKIEVAKRSLNTKLKISTDPRSSLKVNVRPISRTPEEILRNIPEKSVVNIRVIPQKNELKRADFERLKQTIENQNTSLEGIRKFTP